MATITAAPAMLEKFDDFQVPLEPDHKTRRLLLRARHLADADRSLVELILTGQSGFRQIARAMHSTPGALSRRFNRLLRRLDDPLVLWLLRDPNLPSLQHRIGLEYFLHGISITELAHRHRLSRQSVRVHIQFLRGWHAAHAQPMTKDQ